MEPDSKILEWNRQGLIPGPGENEEEFLQRGEYCLHLKSRLQEELIEDIPFRAETMAAESCLADSFAHSGKHYDISPAWVPLFFSNYQLSFWQGGCAWIFQVSEDSPTAALIQLRQRFRDSKNYLGLYSREELLTHELAHIGRLAFEEPKFEEFLAYRSSRSAFRRWFGPIVKSSFESLLFVILLIMVLILDLSFLMMGSEKAILWTKLIPLGLLGIALVRLGVRHRQCNRCFEKLKQMTRDPDRANAILYRLTDLEIIGFSRMKLSDINAYISEQESSSLRWKVIKKAYLSEA